MKKINLLLAKSVLSRTEMKSISGGSGTCAVPCRTLGSTCVTTQCQSGRCEYYMGFFGCVKN